MIVSSLPTLLTVSVFSPSAHVALAPFSISVVPTLISMPAFGSIGVAVTLFVALLVVAVYSSVSVSKAGVKVNEPIVSPDKPATLLPLL